MSLDQLPKEVKSLILSGLSGQEIISVCQTNKNLSQLCSSDPKFNNLWRRKIEEEFREAYNGESAYEQYKYLHRLYNKDFYYLYNNNEDSRARLLLGVYNTYGQAVMAAMDYIEDSFKGIGKKVNLNQLRYLLWNKATVTIENYFHYWIENDKLNRLEKVYDERDFFANREKLYVDLFGESSNGASQIIPDPFVPKKQKLIPGGNRKTRTKKIGQIKQIPKNIKFFKQLDILIDYLNRPINPRLLNAEEEQNNQKIREFVEEWNLNDRQASILNDYLHKDAIFNPQEEKEEKEEQTDEEASAEDNDNSGSYESEETSAEDNDNSGSYESEE